MRSSLIAVVLISAIPAGAEAQRSYTIINPENARELEELCSRPGPGSIQRYWLPQESDVRPAEQLLAAYVAKLQRPSAPLSEYYRQYVGIIVDDRQLLYINLFHQSFFETWDFVEKNVPGKGLPPRDLWLRDIVNVCDGGDHFWGILFDPKKKTFSSPQFNGVARLPPNKALQLTGHSCSDLPAGRLAASAPARREPVAPPLV